MPCPKSVESSHPFLLHSDEYPSKLYEFEQAKSPYFGYLMLEEGDVLKSLVTFTLAISVPAAVSK